MRRWFKISPLSPILWILFFALSSCSDSNNESPPTTPDVDQVAPVVLDIEPHEDTNVALDAAILIEFSEAMDQTTADGNITLSYGTVTTYSWVNETTLSISHTAWDQSTEVTVTVGTGMKDLAGNPLPQMWTASFWTLSPSPVFLEGTPVDAAIDVNRSTKPMIRFSQRMDRSGLAAATTISEVGAPLAAIPAWEMTELEGNWYRILFSGDLSASTTYTIDISTDAPVQGGGAYLSEAVSLSFTTGAATDNHPPRILSITPNGGTVNADQTTVVIAFDESIDYYGVQPNRMAAHLQYLVASEPTWNPDYTQMTVYLQPPLPAGVRLFAVFEAGSFADLSGNYNTVADSISITVAGSANYYPVSADWEYRYTRVDYRDPVKAVGLSDYLVTSFDNISGNNFDTVDKRWDELGQGWVEDNRQYWTITSSGLYIRGFEDGDSQDPIMINPAALYQKLPMQAETWTGTGTIGIPPMAMDLYYSGQSVAPEILVAEPEEDQPVLVWEDCWKCILYHELTAGQEMMETGADTVWYAPGIGVIQRFTGNIDYGEGRPKTDWSRQYLEEIDFGD